MIQLPLTDFEDDNDEIKILPELKISLTNYSNTNVYFKSDELQFVIQYQNLLKNSQKVLNLLDTADMDDVILKNGSNYVIGATFANFSVVGWYNNEFLHSSPLSLNLINQAILKAYSGENYSIEVTNKPYYERERFSFRIHAILYVVEIILIACIISFSFISLFSSINVKERTSGMKLMQFNYGFNRFAYWMTSLFLDGFMYFTVCFVLSFAIAMNEGPSRETFYFLRNLIWSSLLFSWHMISYIYLLSTMFRKAFNLKMVLTFVTVIPGTMSKLIFITKN